MAKAIKFPLEMDGEQIRDIDSLKEHFDIEKVVEYFLNGKLLTWLEARYYDDEAEAVAQLSGNDPDIAGKLCDIFGIEHEEEPAVDIEAVAERNARIAKLKEYTDDEEIIRNVDSVAFDQEDLAELYDRGVEKIYLCAGEFRIPKSKLDLKYIMIGNVTAKGLEEKWEAERQAKKKQEEGKRAAEEWEARKIEKAQLKEAEELFLQYKTKDAFDIFKGLAEKGKGRAMYFLGEYYAEGYLPVEKDMGKSADWRKKGRDAEDTLAAVAAAKMIRKSKKEREKTLAALLNDVSALAKQSDVFAQIELAEMYLNGSGAAADKNEAIRWAKESAKAGYWKAQYMLGNLLYDRDDEDVGADVIESAYKWYRKAAEKGYAPAQNEVGDFLKRGWPKGYGDSERKASEEEEREAFGWYMKSAMQNDAMGQKKLGSCYEYGIGTENDDKQAFMWYMKSAEQGCIEGQMSLARCYEDGDGVKTNLKEAVKWYRKAAAQGSTAAKFAVERMADDIDAIELDPNSPDYDVYTVVRARCKEFLSRPLIPLRMQMGTNSNLEAALKIEKMDVEDIYFAYDDTFMRTGKNGFAITRDGVYCCDSTLGLSHVSYQELAKARLYINKNNIFADNKAIAHLEGSERERNNLLKLFNVIAKLF